MKKSAIRSIIQLCLLSGLSSWHVYAAELPLNRSIQPPFEKTAIAKAIEGSSFEIQAQMGETEKDGKKDVTLTGVNSSLKPADAKTTQLIYETYRPKELRKMFEAERKQALKQIMYGQKQGLMQQRYQGASEDWHLTTWGAQTRRFPMETIMFFFSIGLINGGMMMHDFAQNPLLMEQHFQTLVDPIGHISFYSFMLVNGYATEFLQTRAFAAHLKADFFQQQIKAKMESARLAGQPFKFNPDDILEDAKNYADKAKTLNPYQSSIAKRAYLGMLPYFGMTAGSMASHFTGDYLRTLQTCAKSLYKEPQKSPQTESSLFNSETGKASTPLKDRLNGISEEPCEVAWREWTLGKKFNQYSPALMSMILSTAGSGLLATQIKNFKNSAVFKGFKGNSYKGYVTTMKLVGIDVTTNMLTKALGGWATTGMKWIGHFSNITLFTALDTAIHSWVEDKVLNFNYGYYALFPNVDAFPKKAETLYSLLEKETKEKFSIDRPSCEKDIQGRDCEVNDIEGFLFNFSETLAKWKEFNQTKALQAHSQWVEKINKFQNMERFAMNFYNSFILDLKQSRACKQNIELCTAEYTTEEILELNAKGQSPLKYDGFNMINYRHFPLYGVEPIDDGTLDLKNWKDNYSGSPEKLQIAQQKRVHQVGQMLEEYLNRRGLDSPSIKDDKSKHLAIINGLKSTDFYQNAKAIDLMRALVYSNSRSVSEVSQAILRQHLNELGYAAPLLNYGQGFTFAFEVNSAYKDLVRDVELPDFYRHLGLSTQFRFSKKTDYLMYSMLCGPNAEKGESISENKVKGIPGFRDLFLPPRLVDDKAKLDICTDKLRFDDSSRIYSQNITDGNANKAYTGAFHVLSQSLKPELKQIILSDKFDLTEDDKKNRIALLNQPLFNMPQWWEKNVEDKVKTQLESFKRDYEEIAVKFLEAQFKGVGTLAGVPLHSSVIRNSIVYSSLQESRTYALVMSEVIKSSLAKADYNSLLSDNSFLKSKKLYKLSKDLDLLSVQAAPYQQDFSALKSGAIPTIFKFQLMNEELLTSLHDLLKNAKISAKKDLNGVERDVVELTLNQKQLDDFEKSIDEKISALEAEVGKVIALVEKASQNKDSKEKSKPVRILEFGKKHLSKVARELLGTASTIRFASDAAENYSRKDISKEEQLRMAEKLKREEQKAKCIDPKRMGTSTTGC